MNTLKITLKQHTPLIHFQHDQEGATLRASEVKPKLDKFILTNLEVGNYKNKKELVPKNWLIGKGEKESHALNYRMKIVAEGKNEEYFITSFFSLKQKEQLNNLPDDVKTLLTTPYFAQEKEKNRILKRKNNWNDWTDGNGPSKKGLLCPKSIRIDIYSIIEDDSFMKLLAEKVQAFFLSQNFGTRQSKGFGCFEVVNILLKINEKEIGIPLLDKEMLLKEMFDFVYKKKLDSKDLGLIFNQISQDYQLLKSGRRKPYAKSKLMLYGLNQLKVRWEKRFIKKCVNNVYATEEEGKYYKLKSTHETPFTTDEKYIYLRSMLGLAQQFEFLLENPPQEDQKNKMIVKLGAISSEIERYRSPLLFKVYDENIYIVGNSVSSELLHQGFKLYVSIQEDQEWEHEEVEKRVIYTPTRFDLVAFMQFAMEDKTNSAKLDYDTIKGGKNK
ncbi:hypothetical protein [Parabacteroides pacaensis]|uniref:hypothetical protein n=1 Tax=Parabacteroides pacaensis TaxID=2086575 RepID=UPI00131D3C1C|nr:hypothetical protein [Parabacteroides pacaensis]